MARPRKVRIFRDLRKSPNWYVEWRDVAGRRHCESCGPKRRDAQKRANQIAKELRRQREDAKRVVQPARQNPAATTSVCSPSAVRLQGLLRCAQVDLPFTVCFEIMPEFLTRLRTVFKTC